MKLGRGGSTTGVSRPRPTGIRASPPGSGVVPFSSSSRRHQIRVPIDCSGRSKSHARVSLTTTLVPTSPEPWKANDRSNHAYGISCLTRPISSVRVKARLNETGTAWAVSPTPRTTRVPSHRGRRARPEKWPDLGLSRLQPPNRFGNCGANNLIRPCRLTGSAPQEIGSPAPLYKPA